MKSVARAVLEELRSSDGFLLQSAAWGPDGGLHLLDQRLLAVRDRASVRVAAVWVKVIW